MNHEIFFDYPRYIFEVRFSSWREPVCLYVVAKEGIDAIKLAIEILYKIDPKFNWESYDCVRIGKVNGIVNYD